MKILLWSTCYLPDIGGLEIMCHTLAKAWVAKGHAVLVISNSPYQEIVRSKKIDGISVLTFPMTNSLLSYDLLKVKAILTKLEETIDAFSPDIVNIHGWFEGLAFYQARLIKAKRYPVVTTLHGLLGQPHFCTPECLKVWKLSDAIVSVSYALEASAQEAGFTHSKMKVIHNGLPLPHIPPVSPAQSDPNQLVMIGRISSEKGFETALKAFYTLIRKHPNLRLDLLGGGPNHPQICEFIKTLGLEEVVRAPGFVHPDLIWSYIDQASMLVIPSSYESFGLVALEAAMRQRPVVASDILGLREVVKHNETGLLVPPNDPLSLSNAISSLLAAPKTRHQMGINAFNRVTTKFSLNSTVDQYLTLFQSLRSQALAKAPC